MAAAPSDPLPALELAEVALGAGEYAEAVVVLDEAVRRADHADPSAESTLADRVYADALKFVEVLRSVGRPPVAESRCAQSRSRQWS